MTWFSFGLWRRCVLALAGGALLLGAPARGAEQDLAGLAPSDPAPDADDAAASTAGDADEPVAPNGGLAQARGDEEPVGASGLPLPRFVSLRSGRVNSRIGPGLAYGVDWMYLKTGLPMEIIQEYDNWRRVRDADGAEGWINQALLSSRRTAMTAPWQRGKDVTFPLLAEPRKEARALAFVQPGVVGTIKTCNGDWCEMTFAGRTGFMAQSQIWGAYPGEAVGD